MARWIACADVAAPSTDVAPVRAFRDLEAVILGEAGEVRVAAGVVERLLVLLVVHVADALEEEQREDELLVVAGVDHAAQQRRRAPQVATRAAAA